jgi:repressor LexA
MDNLTQKQQDILNFIASQKRETDLPPTVREIADHFGFRSPKAASDHLAALEKKGYIIRSAGIARGLTLVKNEDEDVKAAEGTIPIVGDVAAGLPILAVENVLGTLSMDSAFGSGDLFAVRVRGDSMIDYGIFESDYVIVRRSPTVDQNAIAVIYVDGEATVKKLRKTNAGYQLIPGNARYHPIVITAETQGFAIAGPVVGVVRSMNK